MKGCQTSSILLIVDVGPCLDQHFDDVLPLFKGLILVSVEAPETCYNRLDYFNCPWWLPNSNGVNST